MQISEQQRIAAYRQTSDTTREFYGSEKLTKAVELIHKKYAVNVAFPEFAEIIGDIILGFYAVSQLPKLLTGIGISNQDAQAMTSEIALLLKPVVQSDDSVLVKKTDLQRLAEQFAEKSKLAQTKTAPMGAVSEQETTPEAPEEAELQKVAPLRTMDGDINRIHGYGAYNEMLEKGGGEHTSSQDGALGKL